MLQVLERKVGSTELHGYIVGPCLCAQTRPTWAVLRRGRGWVDWPERNRGRERSHTQPTRRVTGANLREGKQAEEPARAM